ncbi:hypothetical protein OF83DRAFT_1087812 [Amylostereum chailletii]|nr:hypothetical protein OF83DRAFT_1087812 [Amylostereum chailletii]
MPMGREKNTNKAVVVPHRKAQGRNKATPLTAQYCKTQMSSREEPLVAHQSLISRYFSPMRLPSRHILCHNKHHTITPDNSKDPVNESREGKRTHIKGQDEVSVEEDDGSLKIEYWNIVRDHPQLVHGVVHVEHLTIVHKPTGPKVPHGDVGIDIHPHLHGRSGRDSSRLRTGSDEDGFSDNICARMRRFVGGYFVSGRGRGGYTRVGDEGGGGPLAIKWGGETRLKEEVEGTLPPQNERYLCVFLWTTRVISRMYPADIEVWRSSTVGSGISHLEDTPHASPSPWRRKSWVSSKASSSAGRPSSSSFLCSYSGSPSSSSQLKSTSWPSSSSLSLFPIPRCNALSVVQQAMRGMHSGDPHPSKQGWSLDRIMRQASDNSGSDVEIEDIDFEDLDGEQVQLVVRCIDDPNTTFEYPRPRFLVWMAK